MRSEELGMRNVKEQGTKRINLLTLFTVICYLLLVSCDSISDSPNKIRTPVKSGYGRIGIVLAGWETPQMAAQPARTVFPSTVFDRYVYTFTKAGETDGVEKIPDNGGFFTLAVGSYTVKVQAYTGDEEPYTLMANGASSEFSVGPGDNVPVEVLLTAVAAEGQGELSYTVTYPAGAEAEITLQKWPKLGSIALNPAGITNGKEQTLELEAGFYLLTVLVSKDGLYAGISETLHIYPDLTTVYAKNYVDEDLIAQSTVTFDANGGSGTTPSPQTAILRTTITLPDGDGLARDGYVFIGWNTNSSGTGTNYAAGSLYTVAGNVTLYAKWLAVEMVWISSGSFEMGKELNPGSGYSDVTPVHTVTLSGFYMGKYEVTQGQYETVMGSLPSSLPSSSYGVGNNYPVYYVSWYDALVFCNKLSIAEGLTPAYRISNSTDPTAWGSVPTSRNTTWDAVTIVSGSTGYRLPTEAQWEYAAKGGNGSPGDYTYAGSNTVGDVAWYSSNSGSKTHEVGKKMPNGLGIYDMSGNVYEWCWDRYGSYSSEAQADPTGASSESDRVRRGGYWLNSAEYVRSAYRYYNSPSYRYNYLGFRLARPTSMVITFNINGGTGTTPSAQATGAGSSITLPSGSGLSRTGYAFGGWNTQADGAGTNHSADSSYTVTGTIALYAKWIAVGTTTYTVSFDANGGNGTAPSAQTAAAGSSITLPSGSGLTRTGYIFDGWNTNESGTGTNYNGGGSYTVTGSITLYARWEQLIFEMVHVPGGSFEMGAVSGGDSDERPVHTVTLSAFSIGKYQVTQAQYQAVMGNNPSYFSSSPATGETQNKRPVENVRWYDALVFCNKLSMTEGLTPAYRISGSTDPADWGSVPTSSNTTWNAVTIDSGSTGYRLPTEAQWEYAARGGNGSPGDYTYAGSNTVGDVAWYSSNSGSKTHEVGKKMPNGLGIYDMSGNVYEWCWDWYGTYPSTAQTDPQGASSGSYRVGRGGSWLDSAGNVRSANRGYDNPSGRGNNIGFRLARP